MCLGEMRPSTTTAFNAVTCVSSKLSALSNDLCRDPLFPRKPAKESLADEKARLPLLDGTENKGVAPTATPDPIGFESRGIVFRLAALRMLLVGVKAFGDVWPSESSRPQDNVWPSVRREWPS